MLLRISRNIILALLLVAHKTKPFRHYKRIFARRCSNDDASLGSLSAHKLPCSVACLQTANCDSFNYYHGNTSVSLNCELLMTSVTGYDVLTPAADWSIYSSHDLVISGTDRFEDNRGKIIMTLSSCNWLHSSS